MPLAAFGVNAAMPSGRGIYCYGCLYEKDRASKQRLRENPREPVQAKRCPRCGIVKDRSAFARNRSAHCGLQGKCRECTAAVRLANSQSGISPPEFKGCSSCKKTLPASEFFVNNDMATRLSPACKSCNRNKVRARKYGIGESWILRIESTKECEVCKKAISGKEKHLDHDHATGLPRGVLCAQCNTMIGLARDSRLILAAAGTYLSRFECELSGVVSNAS